MEHFISFAAGNLASEGLPAVQVARRTWMSFMQTRTNLARVEFSGVGTL